MVSAIGSEEQRPKAPDDRSWGDERCSTHSVIRSTGAAMHTSLAEGVTRISDPLPTQRLDPLDGIEVGSVALAGLSGLCVHQLLFLA